MHPSQEPASGHAVLVKYQLAGRQDESLPPSSKVIEYLGCRHSAIEAGLEVVAPESPP